MNFEVIESLDRADVDAIVIAIPEGSDATACDARFRSRAVPLFSGGDLPLKPLEIFVLPDKPKLVFVGLPKNADAEAWRRAAGTVVRRLKNVRSLAFAGGDVRALVEGALVG